MADEFLASVTSEIPRLRRLARGLARHPDRAEDLVQDTLVRALAGRGRFEPGTNLRAWLFAILRNERRASVRRDARSPLAPAGDDIDRAAVSGGQEERQAMRDLSAAFTRLSREQREAVILVVGEGLGYASAAQRQNVPLGTLRSRLARARVALRRSVGLAGPEPADG